MKNRTVNDAGLVMVLLCVGLIFLGLRHENAGGGPGQSQTTDGQTADGDTQSQAQQDITATLAVCGDIMKIYLKIEDDIIKDVKFETFGCGSAIASSSMATEMIKGKTVDEALAVTNRQVVDALGGLPAHKLHCSVLAEESIKSAVKDYYDRNGIAYDRSKFPEDCGSCESCRMV